MQELNYGTITVDTESTILGHHELIISTEEF